MPKLRLEGAPWTFPIDHERERKTWVGPAQSAYVNHLLMKPGGGRRIHRIQRQRTSFTVNTFYICVDKHCDWIRIIIIVSPWRLSTIHDLKYRLFLR